MISLGYLRKGWRGGLSRRGRTPRILDRLPIVLSEHPGLKMEGWNCLVGKYLTAVSVSSHVSGELGDG